MTLDEIFEILGKRPELEPISEKQKQLFLSMWRKNTSYEARRTLVGSISSFCHNRDRYRELLTDPKDIAMFNRIMTDEDTKF